MDTTADDVFVEHRDRLVGLAYRMLGQISDAEDAVQETFVRWTQAPQAEIANAGGWLTTVCSRICLDRLRSAAHRRETYVGPWLPEPVRTDDLDLADATAMGESLTMAFLVVLESLSPLERVAFLLHDVFGYGHDELAAMLERTPASVRQLVSRARRNVAARRPRFEADPDRRWEVATSFLEAAANGSVGGLVAVLAPDVVFTSDGGGLVSAARRPVTGPANVARLLLGLYRQAPPELRVEQTEVNGMPAVVASRDARPETVIVLDVADGLITAIRAVRNPHKLAGLDRSVGDRDQEHVR